MKSRSLPFPRLRRAVPLGFACCLLCLPAAAGTRTWTIGDSLRITAPESFSEGEEFAIQLDFLKKPETPQRLGIGFDHLAAKGAFAGSLQKVRIKETVSDVQTVHWKGAIEKSKPGLTVALLTVYLSPDGTWKNRTLQAVVPIRPAAGGDDEVFERAVRTATAQTGEPPRAEAAIEEYVPRTEYFTQRADDGAARSWRTAPQNLPPLAEIAARPPEPRPVYGIYCWADEYARAHAEIAALGIRSVRLSGPWDGADRAMELAAGHGVEVLFTLKASAGKAASDKRDRSGFESDEAFLEAFRNNVTAFVKRHGPGGELPRSAGFESPLAVVEIWNEPNFFYMIPDGADRKAMEPLREALYPKVLRTGYETVKSLAPSLRVAGFAAGGADAADVRFIARIFEANPDIGGFFDILTTHPYNKGAPPEAEKVRPWGAYSIANNLAAIRSAMGASASKPVWYSELGWHFAGKHGGAFETPKNRLGDVVPPDLHAAYVTRMFAWAMRLGVPRVHVMNLHDADGFNGGFFNRSDLAWRPVAHATRTMIAILPNPKLIGALADGENGVYAYRFQADHAAPTPREAVYAWSTAPQRFEFPVRAAEVTLVDMVGNRRAVPAAEGKVAVEVGPYPLYLLEGSGPPSPTP